MRESLNTVLEHPEHDRSNKGEGEIRGNNAQLADESHGKPPWFTSQIVVTHRLASGSHLKKSASLLYRARRFPRGTDDVVKNS